MNKLMGNVRYFIAVLMVLSNAKELKGDRIGEFVFMRLRLPFKRSLVLQVDAQWFDDIRQDIVSFRAETKTLALCVLQLIGWGFVWILPKLLMLYVVIMLAMEYAFI